MKNDEFDRRVRSFFDTAPRPAAPAALRALPATLPEAPGARRRRGNLSMAGAGIAATIVLATGLVGFALLAGGLRGGAASSVVPSSASSSTPAAVGSPSIAPRPAPDSLTWEMTKAGREARAFLRVAGGFVQIAQPDGAAPEVRVSADAVRWETTTDSLPTRSAAANGTIVVGVATGPMGFLAYGRDTAPSAWTSTDGTHWQEAAAFAAPGTIEDAAFDGGAWYAVSDTPADGPGTTSVWRIDAGGATEKLGEWTGNAPAIAVSRGTLIVSWPGGSDGRRAEVSANAASWTEARLPFAGRIVAVSDGFLAVADDGRTSASTDGVTWSSPGGRTLPARVTGLWAWQDSVLAAVATDTTNCSNRPRLLALDRATGTWVELAIDDIALNAGTYCLATENVYPVADGFFAIVGHVGRPDTAANVYYVHPRPAAPQTSPTPEPTPVPSAAITKEQVVATVQAWIGRKVALTVQGPEPGGFGLTYQIVSDESIGISGWVDAMTGRLMSLLDYAKMPATSAVRIGEAEAQQKAEAYLVAHAVPFDGMKLRIELYDGGGSREYRITWQRYQGEIKLPDVREVRINPATGDVFDYMDTRVHVGPVPEPKITKEQAIASARTAAAFDQATIGAVDLEVALTQPRAWKLVWSVDVDETGGLGHALVYVDAQTGEATVMGRG